MAVGRVLRAFRKGARLSQEDLGARAQVHRTYVGGVERGERNPSAETLSRLLRALGASWKEFGAEMDAQLGRAGDE